jgi:hypothetical protein
MNQPPRTAHPARGAGAVGRHLEEAVAPIVYGRGRLAGVRPPP